MCLERDQSMKSKTKKNRATTKKRGGKTNKEYQGNQGETVILFYKLFYRLFGERLP